MSRGRKDSSPARPPTTGIDAVSQEPRRPCRQARRCLGRTGARAKAPVRGGRGLAAGGGALDSGRALARSTASCRRSVRASASATGSHSTGVSCGCTQPPARGTCSSITARRVLRSICRKPPSRAAEQLGVPRARGRWLAIQSVAAGGRRPRAFDRRRVARAQDLARLACPHDRLRPAHARGAERCLGGGVSGRCRVRGRGHDASSRPRRSTGRARIIGSIVTARATRSAQVRHWWGARGFIVSRLMRVRLGPVELPRDLPRGRSRALPPGERRALLDEIEAGGQAPRASLPASAG